MSERCDRCGKVMRQEDYDAEHATIHVGTCGTRPETGVFFGDAFYLLCHDCLEEFLEKFGEWMGGDADCSDAETIQRQQERIAELERELESLQVVDWWTDEHGDTHAIAANGHEVCHYVRGEHAEAVNGALAERDALIRDMHRECMACGYSCRTDNGECGIIQRIRKLGIEVDG